MGKAIFGYDPENFVSTDVEARDMERRDLRYRKVKLPPPITGKHRFKHCQQLYVDIHNFLGKGQWAEFDAESRIEGGYLDCVVCPVRYL